MGFDLGLIFIVAVMAVMVTITLLRDHPDDMLADFRNQCRNGGMDFDETEAAIAIRIAFVRLRSAASDCCMAKSGNISRAEINEIASAFAIGLASAHGQQAAKSFIGWVDSCPDEEILYDDARAVRHKHTVESLRTMGLYPPRNVELDQDFRDAFKIVRN